VSVAVLPLSANKFSSRGRPSIDSPVGPTLQKAKTLKTFAAYQFTVFRLMVKD
jgi:hypothetical protein